MEILLVEDNRGDVILVRKAFEATRQATRITVARNGQKAMQILHREGEYANAAIPDIILLDLNLPKRSGISVLEEIKADPALRRIPVLILTSSRAEKDIIGSYDRHANAYVVKAREFETLQDMAKKIEEFWFSQVLLPGAIEAKNDGVEP